MLAVVTRDVNRSDGDWLRAEKAPDYSAGPW